MVILFIHSFPLCVYTCSENWSGGESDDISCWVDDLDNAVNFSVSSFVGTNFNKVDNNCSSLNSLSNFKNWDLNVSIGSLLLILVKNIPIWYYY